MKKLCLLVIMFSMPGLCQTLTYPALSTNNTFTGTNTFNSTVTVGSGGSQVFSSPGGGSIALAVPSVGGSVTVTWPSASGTILNSPTGTGFSLTEGTCSGNAAGVDVLCADSSTHSFKASLNNAAFTSIPLIAGDLGGTSTSPTVISAHFSGATTNLISKFNASGNSVNSSITDDGNTVSSAEFAKFGNTVRLTTDFTLAGNTSLQTFLSWTMPTTGGNWSFHCWVPYSQATAAVSDTFGIQATSTPTRIDAGANVYTGSSTAVYGHLRNLASTTATSLVTFTPGSTATFFYATIDGSVQLPAGANTINIMASQSNASDIVTISADSYCSFAP